MEEDLEVQEEQLDQQAAEALEQFTGDVKGIVDEPNPDPLDAPKTEKSEPTVEESETEQDDANAKVEETEVVEEPEAPDEPEEDKDGVYEPPTYDPGEFAPKDYSFKVTTTDGKTHTIASQDDAEEFADLIDDNPDLINAKQFLAFTRGANRMDAGIEKDKAEWESQQAEFTKSREIQQQRDAVIVKINNGLNYLETKGLIPELDAKLNTPEAGKDWSTKYKDETGVKERLEILNYMEKENADRMAAGLDPSFDVVDAYKALQSERLQQQERDIEQRESDVRRKQGAMVGGNSSYTPPTSNNSSTDIVGSGGSLNDLLMEAY